MDLTAELIRVRSVIRVTGIRHTAWTMRQRLARVGLLTVLLAPIPLLAEEAGDGEKLFMDNCAECHQPDGRGLRGVYPSLVASEIVRGSGVDVALQLIIGRGEMPSFAGALTAAEMAQLINFIRSTWTDSKEAISADTVATLLAQ